METVFKKSVLGFAGITWILERQKVSASEDFMDSLYSELRVWRIFLYSLQNGIAGIVTRYKPVRCSQISHKLIR